MNPGYVPSTWKRLTANFIDQIVMGVLYLPFVGIFYRLILTEQEVYISLVQLFILFLIPLVYEFIFLVIMQRTPGKWFLGLTVVPSSDPDQKLELGQCLLRPLAKRLQVFFSWAIFALAFFRYDRTHLPDWLAETRVVQDKPRPSRARIRWIMGGFFVAMYAYEGLVSANYMIKAIDWQQGEVNLRLLLPEQPEFDFESDW